MSFSNEWSEIYYKNQQIYNWPWSDLIGFVKKYTNITKKSKILELGTGSGGNIPFFMSLDLDYYGIEGSKNILSLLENKYPNLKGKLVSSDFSKNIPFDFLFDLIIDRSSVTFNKTLDIENTIKLIYSKLNTNGIFIGIDWYSTEHSEYLKGDKINDDIYTRCNYIDGPFKDLGNVHFSDENHLLSLFDKFDIKVLDKKIYKSYIPKTNYESIVWNFVAQKK